MAQPFLSLGPLPCPHTTLPDRLNLVTWGHGQFMLSFCGSGIRWLVPSSPHLGNLNRGAWGHVEAFKLGAWVWATSRPGSVDRVPTHGPTSITRASSQPGGAGSQMRVPGAGLFRSSLRGRTVPLLLHMTGRNRLQPSEIQGRRWDTDPTS